MTTSKNFIDFVKFEHSIFALPFIYAGMLIAMRSENFDFDVLKFILITIAAVSARSTAMALNRLIDANIDALNLRTADRHIPSGIIKKNEAWTFAIISGLLFFASVYFLNFICFILAPIPLLMFIIYPYLKRHTYFSHLFLGLTLGIGVGGGYVAITGNFENLVYPLILCFFVIFWVAGFDIIYAIQDVKFDKKQNLYSVPVKFGVRNALRISLLFHLISIGSLMMFYVLFWLLFSSAFVFGFGIAIIALLLIYEHKICYSDVSEATIQKAFFTTNAIVGVCFLVFLFLGLYF
ncbi:MAG: 4-hydroxybenzoate octaprenyltransferase [Candidatus Altarchaeum sp.]|nr:4-hydroxybenzoate octaprenyltransferase [Candidatus Altarchaeum sp.]